MVGRTEASKVIRPFDGEGDVAAWLAKVVLCCKPYGSKRCCKARAIVHGRRGAGVVFGNGCCQEDRLQFAKSRVDACIQ